MALFFYFSVSLIPVFGPSVRTLNLVFVLVVVLFSRVTYHNIVSDNTKRTYILNHK